MTLNMPPAGNVPRSLMQYAAPASLEPGPDDFDLTSGFRLIRRRIGMIVALSVLLTAAAIPLILGLQPVYHAESRLMIHPPLAAAFSAGGSERGNSLDLASEIERLHSQGIAERVIRDLKLDELKEFNPALRTASFTQKLRERLRGLFHRREAAPVSRDGMERVILEYYRALSVQRDGATAVIRIGFDSRDPELAAAVPNRMIGIYLQERQASQRNRLASALAWITARIDDQRDRVNSAREAMEQYGKATGIASEGPDEQSKAVMELSVRQARIAQSRAEVNATISALKTAANKPEALASLVVPDSIGNLERDLRRQQLDLDRLLKVYGDNAEEVVALRTRILKTQSDLGVERERYIQSQRARLADLDRQETMVQADLLAARRKLSGNALAQAELTRLQHVASREQAALDKFEEQRRALAGEIALPGAEAEILSPAAVPLLPQGHGKLFYLIAAMLLSVGVAVTAAFIREMMDKSVRSHDQLEAVAGVVPAGFIPLLSRKEGRSLPVFSGYSQGGMFGEAIRTTIISLAQSNGGKLPGSVVVTSAHGGEGKSLIARSLAIELAATGQPVLLIDGDLRRGSLGALFKPGLKQGLNEFLSGEAGLADIVHHHSRTGIDFIPRGNPSLYRRPNLAGMADILELTRANGQIAIFDSAPILASTDTVQLTALTERTVMVVQWAKTSRHAVEYALRCLKSISTSNALIAINKVKPRRHALYGFTDSELYSKSLKKYRDITL